MNLTGKTALVTGASAGIGKAFALELAARGADLIVTARRKDRLDELATEIRQKHGRKVTVIAADLAQRDAPEQLMTAIKAHGLQVDVLINNAGYGLPGFFRSHTWQEHADFLQVLVTSVVHLSHLCVDDMVKRGEGQVINVASLAGLLPSGPSHTLYGAAKSFLIKFSESLHSELSSRGVNICAVCPGFTYSEFHDVAGNRKQVSKLPNLMWMDADTVARQGLDAVARGEFICVNGAANKALAGFFKVLPERPGLRLMTMSSQRTRKQA